MAAHSCPRDQEGEAPLLVGDPTETKGSTVTILLTSPLLDLLDLPVLEVGRIKLGGVYAVFGSETERENRSKLG